MSALKVSQVINYIKKSLSMDYFLNSLEVEGEISNFVKHKNGNIYFSLKDEVSKIDALIPIIEAQQVSYDFKDGDKVIVKGAVSIFERDSGIRLMVNSIKLKGLGELSAEFLRLKEKLNEEGLFLEKYKKNINIMPKKIGIITSPSGAAIHDTLSILKRRNKTVDIFIYPALVQGDKASLDLIEGIKFLDNLSLDTIIITRGGGAQEDLSAFNNEDLARTIFKAKTPIISAVGHEIDFTICDFVSDLRAPTPSAAAELVSVDIKDLLLNLNFYKDKLNFRLSYLINSKNLDLNKIYIKFRDMNMANIISEKFYNLRRTYIEATNAILDLHSFMKNNINNLKLNLVENSPKNIFEENKSLINSLKANLDRSLYKTLIQNKSEIDYKFNKIKILLDYNLVLKEKRSIEDIKLRFNQNINRRVKYEISYLKSINLLPYLKHIEKNIIYNLKYLEDLKTKFNLNLINYLRSNKNNLHFLKLNLLKARENKKGIYVNNRKINSINDIKENDIMVNLLDDGIVESLVKKILKSGENNE